MNLVVKQTKLFSANDFSSNFDKDSDTMNNLDEVVVGGNPFNPAPTILSASEITVLENSVDALKVFAISPRSDTLVYSIVNNDTDSNGISLFTIEEGTGLIGFINPVPFNNSAANDYQLDIEVYDGTYTSSQSIAISVTDVFDLKYNVEFQQLHFYWNAYPNADFYSLLISTDNGLKFTQLADGNNISSLNFSYPFSVHLFDRENTQFK